MAARPGRARQASAGSGVLDPAPRGLVRDEQAGRLGPLRPRAEQLLRNAGPHLGFAPLRAIRMSMWATKARLGACADAVILHRYTILLRMLVSFAVLVASRRWLPGIPGASVGVVAGCRQAQHGAGACVRPTLWPIRQLL